MSDRHAAIFDLLRGFTYADILKRYGIPESTARRLKQPALKKLGEMYPVPIPYSKDKTAYLRMVCHTLCVHSCNLFVLLRYVN